MSETVTHMLFEFIFRGFTAIFQHYKRMRRFSPTVVRHPDNRHFLDGRVAQQTTFYFNRRNVLASADDDVLKPVPNLDVTIGMDHGCVAGVKPTVLNRRIGRTWPL